MTEQETAIHQQAMFGDRFRFPETINLNVHIHGANEQRLCEIIELLKDLKQREIKVDADVVAIVQTIQDGNAQQTKNNADIVAAINKINTQGLDPASRTALQQANSALQAQNAALKAQDDQLEAVLGAPTPAAAAKAIKK